MKTFREGDKVLVEGMIMSLPSHESREVANGFLWVNTDTIKPLPAPAPDIEFPPGEYVNDRGNRLTVLGVDDEARWVKQKHEDERRTVGVWWLQANDYHPYTPPKVEVFYGVAGAAQATWTESAKAAAVWMRNHGTEMPLIKYTFTDGKLTAVELVKEDDDNE